MNRFVRSAALALCAAAVAVAACGAQKSDSTLAFEVDQELSLSPLLAGTQIEVAAQEGAVTLRGVVSREEQRATAERLAWSVPGVESVESQIEISSSPSAAPPAVGAGPSADVDPTQ